MRLNSFENMFIDQLNDLYSAEKQLVAALPKLAEAASTPQLKQAFQNHLEQTQGHMQTLEQMLTGMNEKAGGHKCKGMEGLIEEGKEVIGKRGDSKVKDAALIAAAQKCEHYEIAGYGSARTFAQNLGYTQAVDMLQQILDQEGETNKLLTALATGQGSPVAINEQATR
ncbi:MAG: ferritin-like domain-containing protein [Caldilineaceae bacterium]|nr:ferritin-like domain-containing protein [Caldilineaceae bacterium]